MRATLALSPLCNSEVWVKPMGDGKRTAVLLLNLADDNTTDLTITAVRPRGHLGWFVGISTRSMLAPRFFLSYTVTECTNDLSGHAESHVYDNGSPRCMGQ